MIIVLPDRTMGPGAFLFGSRAMFHIVASWEANPAPAATSNPSRVILQYRRLVKVGFQNFRPMTAMHANICNRYGSMLHIEARLQTCWLVIESYIRLKMLAIFDSIISVSKQYTKQTNIKYRVALKKNNHQPIAQNRNVQWSRLLVTSLIFQNFPEAKP